MSIILPKSKIQPTSQDPKNLIIFSKPKIGKSTACAALENNLCIDLEDGYAYIESMAVPCKTVGDLKNVCKAILDEGRPYKFITIDTVTALEEMVKPLALQLYKDTPAGVKFTKTNVLDAPMGAGYAKIREAMEMVINMISKCADNIILICHTKDAAIAEEDGSVNVKAIDLSGKSGRILSAKSDAIGYMYRDENSNTVLSFDTSDKFAECGARPQHLRNANVILGKSKEDGTIEFDWSLIYPSLKQ